MYLTLSFYNKLEIQFCVQHKWEIYTYKDKNGVDIYLINSLQTVGIE